MTRHDYEPDEVIELFRFANLSGIARFFGVSDSVVASWERSYADFPPRLPLPNVKGIGIFDLEKVVQWARLHRLPRSQRGHSFKKG